jgi:hypothetical protein
MEICFFFKTAVKLKKLRTSINPFRGQYLSFATFLNLPLSHKSLPLKGQQREMVFWLKPSHMV